MLQRAGKKIDSKEAVLKIKDASYPAPFASELEYNSPVHGNWNIVHSGMQVPESIQIYVCADSGRDECGRSFFICYSGRAGPAEQ